MHNHISTIETKILKPAKAKFDDDVLFWQESSFAKQAFRKNSKLAEAALANPQQAIDAVQNISSFGITLNPARSLAYLVAYKGSIVLQVSYMGLLKAAQDTGNIRMACADVVRSKDKFELRGMSEEPIHTFDPFATLEQRGEIVGAYATFKLNDTDWYTQTMRLEEIKHIKSLSQMGRYDKGPWKDFPEQMIIKTVIKRGIKYIQGSPKLDNMVQYMNNVCGEGIEFDSNKPKPKTLEAKAIEGVCAVVGEKKDYAFYKDYIENQCEEVDELEDVGEKIKNASLTNADKELLKVIYKEKRKELGE